jgi:hypothetical protein
MCGRYVRRGSAEKVSQWFDIEPEATAERMMLLR